MRIFSVKLDDGSWNETPTPKIATVRAHGFRIYDKGILVFYKDIIGDFSAFRVWDSVEEVSNDPEA